MLVVERASKSWRQLMLLMAIAALMLGWITYMSLGWFASVGAVSKPLIPNLEKLPLAFESNLGQIDPSVKYIAHAPGGTLFFTSSEVVLAVGGRSDNAARSNAGLPSMRHSSLPASHPAPLSLVRMTLLGANSAPEIESGAPLPGKVNYLLGNDPSRWHTDLPTYASITYKDSYAGIDLRFEGTGRQLKGTYTVAAGVDPAQIRWKYSGVQKVSVDEAGNLRISVAPASDTGGEIVLVEQAPVAWQEIGGRQIAVSASYLVSADGTITFKLGEYDPAHPLIIDPVLAYSTYFGGSLSDDGLGIDVDGAGNIYIAGETQSLNFPVQNPYQQSNAGGSDAFVSKLNATGSTVLYSTYLGGNLRDLAADVIVDAQGNIFLTGFTSSGNFPLMNPIRPTYGGGDHDGFVSKLNAAGSALIYSTYLGGSAGDQALRIALDGLGNAYVVGETSSPNYPLANAYQTALRGWADGFVTKINAAGSALMYSTYLGGSNGEGAYGLAVDTAGNAYVAGVTWSFNFPTANPMQPGFAGGQYDAFVTKFNAAGTGLIYSTYLGAGSADYAANLTIDSQHNVYVTGQTASANFPTANPLQSTYGGGAWDAFVSKINSAGSGLVYSTYLGGNSADMGRAVAVDGSGNAHLMGITNSSNFPTANPLQLTYGGGPSDLFVSKLNTAGNGFVYSTFLGGSGDESSNGGIKGLTVDSQGNAYLTGYTTSTNFPTANPIQTANAGVPDAIIVKIADGPPAGSATPTTPTSTPTRTPTPVCVPGWNLVSAPTYGTGNNLWSVAAITGDDVWIVGTYRQGGIDQTLTMHWNGVIWKVIASPNVGGSHNQLLDVVALSADDMWAVGYYFNGSVNRTLILHWNGTGWKTVTSPNAGAGSNYLVRVGASSPNNVWAVGRSTSGGVDQPLALHWDGTSWTLVPTPNPVGPGQFFGVAPVAPNDVWAVGYYRSGSIDQTLTMHWDGAAWTIISSPNVPFNNQLTRAKALSSNDVWAVGFAGSDGGPYGTLTLHWNGTQWSIVSSPNAPPSSNYLYGLEAIAANDVWATGYQFVGGRWRTLTLHWNGTQWNIVSSPSIEGSDNYLYSLEAVSANDIWAVGTTAQPIGNSLVLRYGGQCGTPSPVATRTNTPQRTPTRPPGTITPQPSPPPCAGCNLRVEDVYIACNLDGTVQWMAVVRNSAPCPILANWISDLQVRRANGEFENVRRHDGKDSLPPGISIIEGDFCFGFPEDAQAMRVEFTAMGPGTEGGDPFGRCRPTQYSHQMEPCPQQPPCVNPGALPPSPSP